MESINLWKPESDKDFFERKIFAFDLDDTLTEASQISVAAIRALEESQKKGFKNVLVTGRPLSWADALLKILPFCAAVAENGAALFWKNDQNKEIIERLYNVDGSYQAEYRGMPKKDVLDKFYNDLRQKFPTVAFASDQVFRFYDYAIDFSEQIVPPLSFEEAEKIVGLAESYGLNAKLSNIHVNVWGANFSKLDGLKKLSEIWGLSLAKNFVYCGDSPNDAPLFEGVEISVGVANLQNFVSSGIEFSLPKYLTSQSYGEGAAELLKQRLSFENT